MFSLIGSALMCMGPLQSWERLVRGCRSSALDPRAHFLKSTAYLLHMWNVSFAFRKASFSASNGSSSTSTFISTGLAAIAGKLHKERHTMYI